MMNKVVIALVLAASMKLGVSTKEGMKLADRASDLFEEFKLKFHRRYATREEEQKRKAIFFESMKRVDSRNEINGQVAFGVTKFSDRTQDEFRVLLGSKSKTHGSKKDNIKVRKPVKLADLSSTYLNWNDFGVVTPIKNQGQCGSCWAFSSTETIESEWAMQGNGLWELSPQQIASCVSTCDGCGGGWQTDAYEYLINGTIPLASAWYAPYMQSMVTGCDGPSCTAACTFDASTIESTEGYAGPAVQISSYEWGTTPCYGACDTQDVTTLAQNLLSYGPIAVTVNAGVWGDYTGGVLTQAACGAYGYDDLDHAVQLVGLVTNTTTPYWIVRNSWATEWGEQGNIYLEYPANTCGVADITSFVNLAKN